MSSHIYALISNLSNKITNLVRRCAVTKSAEDRHNYQVVQVQYFGKIANVEVVSIYGISYNPPINSTGLMWTVLGDEENRTAIFYLPQDRAKGLKPGEIEIGNLLTKSSVKFDAEGNIIVTSTKGVIIKSAEDVSIESATNVEIKATTINIDGDVNITGTLTASDDVVTGTISLKTHVHSGVTAGAVNSGPPL